MQTKLRFRNTFGEAQKEKIEGTKASDTNSDSCLIKGNPLYFGLSWKTSGGGALAVLPIDKKGKLPATFPMIRGHNGPIIEFDFYPFNDSLVGTASDDTTVKIWEIPSEFKTDLIEAKAVLQGHHKKVNLLQFNHTADNVAASTSFDNTVKIWDVERQNAVHTLSGPNDPYYSIDWSMNGSLLALTNKDKFTRIADPRANKFVHEFKGHEGPKGQKIIWLGSTGLLYSVGFNNQYHREYLIWDVNNLGKPLEKKAIDQQASVLYPYFDSDTNLLFLAGKGDTNIRVFEYNEGKLFAGLEFQSSVTQKGVGFFPKRSVDVTKNELNRAMKLTENYVEFISFKQPRKADGFQEDLFPDCIGDAPALSCDEWFNGKTSLPSRKSMKPDASPTTRISRCMTIPGKDRPIETTHETNHETSNEIETLKNEVQASKGLITQLKEKVNILTLENDNLRQTIEALTQELISARAQIWHKEEHHEKHHEQHHEQQHEQHHEQHHEEQHHEQHHEQHYEEQHHEQHHEQQHHEQHTEEHHEQHHEEHHEQHHEEHHEQHPEEHHEQHPEEHHEHHHEKQLEENHEKYHEEHHEEEHVYEQVAKEEEQFVE